MSVHVKRTSAGHVVSHSGYMPGYVSWVRWYDAIGASIAMMTNASDTVRLLDDGFTWVDSLAATVERCRAPIIGDRRLPR